MAVPTWLSAVGHFASDVVGVIIGTQILHRRTKPSEEGNLREAAAEAAGKGLEQTFLLDREDVMKDLLRLGEDGEAILELLKEAEESGGIITVGEKGKKKQYKTENFVVSMLLKVEPKDRWWIYPIFNRVCKFDRRQFFTLLEILHNDGFAQGLKVVLKKLKDFGINLKDATKEGWKTIDKQASAATPQVKRLADWLGKQKGAKR